MTEIFKDIKGWEDYYQVSNFGRVKSKVRAVMHWRGGIRILNEKFLEPAKDGNGYPFVGLFLNKKRRFFKLHQLIARAFIPNPENKPHINHKNGIKDDYRIENLEWCTVAENHQHAFATKIRKGKRIAKIQSRYQNVCWNKQSKKWHVQFKRNCKNYFIGAFNNEEEAAKTAQMARANF